MIFKISCSILEEEKKLFSSIFTFSKQSFLGIFFIFGKNTPKLQKLFKNGQNHQFALLSFTFHQKNPLFDIDLFSRTFDMESPTDDKSIKVPKCEKCDFNCDKKDYFE